MAEHARVLFQRGGHGAIVFAGQPLPALALRADELKRLHDLAHAAMTAARAAELAAGPLRSALQELHLELATLQLELQDTAARHGQGLPPTLRVASRDFLTFDDRAPDSSS